jgi:hypothetical protein
MVERSREIRDRVFLTTLFLVGGVALAAGLFEVFILQKFQPSPEFSVALGAAILLVTALFETPLREPELVGLPGPGLHLERRSYLPYPVPLPDSVSPPSASRPLSASDVEAVEVVDTELDMVSPTPPAPPSMPAPVPLPTPVARPAVPSASVAPRPVAARPSPRAATASSSDAAMATLRERTNREVADAREAIAALETLGNLPPAGGSRAGLPFAPLPPLQLKPIIAEHPPPADYLEEHLPRTPPAVDGDVQRSLTQLADLAGSRTDGSRPLALINGKPPTATLTDIETTLDQSPPLEVPRAPATSPESAPSAATNGSLEKLDHAEAELKAMPPVESVVPVVTPPSPRPRPAPRMPAPSGRAPPGPSVVPTTPLVSPTALPSAPPVPPPKPTPSTPAAPAPSTPPRAYSPASAPPATRPQDTTVADLDQMARVLDAMIAESRGARPPALAPPRPPTVAPAVPAVALPLPPRPPTVEPPAPPVGPSQASAELIDELSRQLEQMKSALAPAGAPSRGGLPLPVPRSERDAKSKPVLPTLPPDGASPPPSLDLGEDELQNVLDQAHQAAEATSARHVKPTDMEPAQRRKRRREDLDP